MQATNDNMAHAHCMLHNPDYKYTFRLCNTHCFSTATMVAQTRLNVTLYVQYIAYLVIVPTFILKRLQANKISGRRAYR